VDRVRGRFVAPYLFPNFEGRGQNPSVYGSIIMRTGDRNASLVTGKKEELSVRSWIACSGWTAILAILLLLLVNSSEIAIQTLLALSVVYVMQGSLAELIGVKIEESGISFPNRVFPGFPYLVLFRCKLPRKSFNRIDFVKRQMFMIYPAVRQINVPVTKSCDEKRVVRFLRGTFPDLSVTIIH
jgi:hypothetical protein